MSASRVFAVVLNYQRANETLECIATLVDSAVKPSRLIVVDNDSRDGSLEKIAAGFPAVDLVSSGGNLGYAGGMNTGIRKALASDVEYVLIVNSDTRVDKDAIAVLVREMDRTPSAGAATGTLYYYPETTRVWYAGGHIAWWRANAVTRRALPAGGVHDSGEADNVSFLTGCAILFRASALRAAGLFDERFFMYQEDAELCMRLMGQGYRLLYVPRARLYHRIEEDADTPLKVYFTMRNRLLLLESAPRLRARIAGTAYFIAMLCLKLTRWALSDRALFRAACLGVLDYRGGRFHEGRGLAVNSQKTPG